MEFSNYAAYNMRTYFYQMPGDLTSCPYCNAQMSFTSLGASLAVKEYFEKAERLIPVHSFTHLLVCPECSWWYIREVFGLYEMADGISDYLIVGVAEEKPPLDHQSRPQELDPWKKAMADAGVYDHALNLTAELGKFFPQR